MKILKDVYEEHALATAGSGVHLDKKVQIGQLIGSNKRVLDVGCSHGAIAEYVRSLGNEVIGIDISERFLDVCRQKGLKVFQCDIENDPSLPQIGMFDVVIVSDILEHFFDPYKVLVDRIRNVMRDGGRLIVAVPNCAYLKHRLVLLFGGMPEFGANMKLPPIRPYNLHHKTFFNRTNLLQTLKMAGFKAGTIHPVRGVTPRGFHGCLAKKLWWFMANHVPTLLAAEFIVAAEKISR